MTKQTKGIIGGCISLTSMILAWVFFNWILVLILMLALWGNNLERKS